MEYKKLMTSKVFEVNSTTGIIVELTETSKENYVSLWLQYRDASGQWAYKSTKGATSIRFPMTKEVGQFITASLATASDVNDKHVKVDTASKVDVKKLTRAELLALLEEIETPKAKAPKAKAPEVEIDFTNELLKGLTATQKKKFIKALSER